MPADRQNVQTQPFEDPYRMVPRAEPIVEVSGTSWVEILPAVPAGHAYQIIDIDVENQDTKTHYSQVRIHNTANNGSPMTSDVIFVFPYGPPMPTGAGSRALSMQSGTFASNTGLYPYAEFFLEAGDSIDARLFAAVDTNNVKVCVSYWDIIQ